MGHVREKKKTATREALLRAGAELFTEHGYDKTTVEDIAEKAVVSKFTFYQYFATKEELLHELHNNKLLQSVTSTAEMLKDGVKVAVAVEAMLVSMADWYEQNQELSKVLLSQGAPPIFREGDCDACLADIIALINAGQATGEFNQKRSSRDSAMYVYLIFYGEKMSWMRANCAYSLKDKLKTAMEFWLAGMTA